MIGGECGYLTVGDGYELRCKLEPGHDGEHYKGAKVFVPITEEFDGPEIPCPFDRVVEIPLPAPTFIGMDLASGPDRTSYRCLNCGSFEVDLVPEFMNQLTCLNCGTRYSPSL